MNKTTLLILLVAVAGHIFADTSPKGIARCEQLTDEVRWSGEEGEKADRFLQDADSAYRDCRGTMMPIEVRMNALLKFGLASDAGGRVQTATDAYNEALGLMERSKDSDRDQIIEVLDLAASAESRSGFRSDALRHSTRAVEERQKMYGRESAEASVGYVNLATIYATFNELDDCEKWLREAVRIAEKACGPECDALALAYSGMQTLYEIIGNKAEAQKYSELAVDAIPPSSTSTKQ